MACVSSGAQLSNVSFTEKFFRKNDEIRFSVVFPTPDCSRGDAEHPVQQSLLSRQKDRRRFWWEDHENLNPGLHHIRGSLQVCFSFGSLFRPGVGRQKKSFVLFLRTGRAVRCVLERGEDMLITGARHPVQGKYKVPHQVLFWFEFPMKVIKGLLLVGLKSGFGAALLGGFHE